MEKLVSRRCYLALSTVERSSKVSDTVNRSLKLKGTHSERVGGTFKGITRRKRDEKIGKSHRRFSGAM